MPIYEDQMAYEDMVRVSRDHCCSECGNILTVAWSADRNGYVLRCGRDITHAGYAKEKKQTMYPGSHVGAIPKKEYKEMEKELGTMTTMKLVPYSTKTALTKSDAREIVETLWPGAPEIEKVKAIALCVHYQLNPLMRHVYLVGYKKRDKDGNVTGEDWSIQVGIQANRLIASRPKRNQEPRPFGYHGNTPRLVTPEEELMYFKKADPTKVRAIVDLIDQFGFHAIGIGQINRDAPIKGQDKGNTHENMACIRAERAALDRKCPGEMPQDVEVIDAEYEVLPDENEAISRSERAALVDSTTGEIAEASPETDVIPEPEPTEQPATGDTVTDTEVEDLKVALADYGTEKHHIVPRKDALAKVLQDVGLFVKAQEWQVKNLKDLNREQLRILHEALNDGKI